MLSRAVSRPFLRLQPFTVSLGLFALGAVPDAWAKDDYEYPHAHEPIGTVEQIYEGTMLPDLAVSTYRNIDRLFPTRTIDGSDHPYALPKAPRQLDNVHFTYEGKKYDLFDYVAVDSITAMLVIKDGKVAYETYQRGNTDRTRWMSMSMAKSVTSTLAAVALHDGAIKSLDDAVVDYVPRLKGSAYEGVTIRNVLTMTSGVKWSEAFTDPSSDRRALLRAQIAQTPGAAMTLMASLPKAAEPGTVNNYSTGETQVLEEVIRSAVKMPLSDYLEQKIWRPFGMEHDAKWWLDSPNGQEIGGSGISATLRDFGRFGLFFMNGGKIAGQSILPQGWVQEATAPTVLKDGSPLNYGYMWWPGRTEASIKDGAYSAIGMQGQNIYINPTHNVVIVTFGDQPKPLRRNLIAPLAFFDAVVAALD
ncbi:serine hydrolase [Pseudomonas sp. SLFW]|uniref:serine hydrolase domain-containing protein n=1 Tax=Pseudomonas sp. SLFW TaxID=2683259 RepID=UPI0014132F56|nr:serine hydrolase [Pseudomonas sp. SLFW]NBB13005.1 serine hydrolase [Pseudomonas sp. SLFW]